MTDAVRAALNALAAEVTREAKVSVSDILEMTVVGNPIMHHLLLGIDPVELGGAPFALATDPRSDCTPPNSDSACIRMPASTPCPASPATSARMPPA